MPDDGSIKKFNKGDVIFNEGEPSHAAFLIVKGAVELTKHSKRGNVRLANLKNGELFGEMGVIDGSPRSATARALLPTTLKVISPQALHHGLKNDPNLSSKVMGKLVERLRAADTLLAKTGQSLVPAPQTPHQTMTKSNGQAQKKKGFFARFFSPDKERKAPFEIAIADFHNDQSEATATVFNILKSAAEKIGGGLINVRRTNSAFAITDFSDHSQVWAQSRTNAQNWLKELDADLLIWGRSEQDKGMMHLRFSQRYTPRHERCGLFQPWDALDLGLTFNEHVAAYLYSIVIGALVPYNKEQHESYEALLAPCLEIASGAMKPKSQELDSDAQARFDVGFANLAANYALTLKQPSSFKLAEESYLKALRNLRRSRLPLMEGVIKRHLAYLQIGWFEQGGEKNLIEASIETFRETCEIFDKDNFPTDWAEMQSMIGQLLFKQDAVGDDDRALKESISAFQSALQVFSATSTPQQWGDTKHHLARSLQLLGSQSGDLDMIARSAEACREALSVRSRHASPMLWAATQNNLGSALFMLCQKTRKPETAEAAVKAFEAALDVYIQRRAIKLAKVTEKNLARAKEVAINLEPLPNEEEIYGSSSNSSDLSDDSFEEDAFDEMETDEDEGEDMDDEEMDRPEKEDY